MGTQEKGKIRSFFEKAGDAISESGANLKHSSVNMYERLIDQRMVLGLTGLSRSGKSTLVTSLINQLLQFDKASMPGFSPVLGGDLLGVKLHPLEDKDLALFPYQKSYQSLCEPLSAWPDSTVDVSGCLLELRLRRKVSGLNPLKHKEFSFFLEIRDYPGEWLLDLPLMDMSFSRWSTQCHGQCATEPRLSLIGSLLQDLQAINPLDTVDKEILLSLNERYKAFLHNCKSGNTPLSLIQPGRFIIPGNISDKDVLSFIPLFGCATLSDAQLDAADENSYYKYCDRLYKRYVTEIIEPFYKTHFKKIDRQLVLVDVINVLSAGPQYIDDVRQALANITDSFSYGHQSRLRQLFTSKIDQVVFVATKIDQVLSEDHEAVRQLLELLVKQAYRHAAYAGVTPYCEAVAAVRASVETPRGTQNAIMGIQTDGDDVGYVHPKIPYRFPESADEWLQYINSVSYTHLTLPTIYSV